MEICVDSIVSAIKAARAGADRIEVCQSLEEGGLTPSMGLLRRIKSLLRIPVFVLIRPRGGDFLYSQVEVEVMEEDISLAVENGADGIVLGALTETAEVDEDVCKRLIRKCCNLPVTFHRAFDFTEDPLNALSTVIELGCSRILTSGQASDVLSGLPMIKKLTEAAGGRITILPGGGINEGNLEEILLGSGAQEFHSSASSYVTSSMKTTQKCGVKLGASSSELQWKQCDEARASNLKNIAKRVWSQATLLIQ